MGNPLGVAASYLLLLPDLGKKQTSPPHIFGILKTFDTTLAKNILSEMEFYMLPNL